MVDVEGGGEVALLTPETYSSNCSCLALWFVVAQRAAPAALHQQSLDMPVSLCATADWPVQTGQSTLICLAAFQSQHWQVASYCLAWLSFMRSCYWLSGQAGGAVTTG